MMYLIFLLKYNSRAVFNKTTPYILPFIWIFPSITFRSSNKGVTAMQFLWRGIVIPRIASTAPVTDGSELPKVSVPCILVGNTCRSNRKNLSFMRENAAFVLGCSRNFWYDSILAQIFWIVKVKFSTEEGIRQIFCHNLLSLFQRFRKNMPSL